VLDQSSCAHSPQRILWTRSDTGRATELLNAEIAFGRLKDGPTVIVND